MKVLMRATAKTEWVPVLRAFGFSFLLMIGAGAAARGRQREFMAWAVSGWLAALIVIGGSVWNVLRMWAPRHFLFGEPLPGTPWIVAGAVAYCGLALAHIAEEVAVALVRRRRRPASRPPE